MSDKDMTKEDLIALALEFRNEKLWEKLDDSMIFGVRLPDGETGYCCIMGHGGQHYGLTLYVGASGITTYMNQVNSSQRIDVFEIAQTYDCLNCDFENAGESNLSSADKKLIRTVATDRNIKICRPKGYPEFIRYANGLLRKELNENEKVNLGMALKAAIAVGHRTKDMNFGQLVELGFDEDGLYPSHDGDTTIPFLELQEDSTFQWSTTLVPKPLTEIFVTPILSVPLAVERLKGMEHTGELMIKVMHMPTPIQCEDGFFYPLMMLLINREGLVFPVMQKSESPHAERELLGELLSTFISMEIYPSEILVDDEYSDIFLKDFCRQTAIRLKRISNLPELENVVWMLKKQFGMF